MCAASDSGGNYKSISKDHASQNLKKRYIEAGFSPKWGMAKKNLKKNLPFPLALNRKLTYIIPRVAGLAQLVARHLAKVEVAGSNPVARSMMIMAGFVFGLFSYGGMAKW